MIQVGTSGYSYPEWKGPFYPAGLPDREFLRYYARHFGAVEINATYYRIPQARTIATMVERAEGRLAFAVKAHQEMTHLREQAEASARQFVAALAPMREAGVLAAVLLQFPFAFRHNPAGRDFLLAMRDRLAGHPLVVEFRHRSWFDAPTLAFLREAGLSLCCVDEPALPGLPPRAAEATGPLGYVRFHGRNAAKWWRHAQAWERYDYTYSEAELREWLPKLRHLEARTSAAFAFFNNHARGQAALNAGQLRALLAAG
jgi:uncharacterized protein YecE (DUF72 family)